MKKNIFLSPLALLCSMNSEGQPGEADTRPNIIWFMVEDIGCYLGCYGDTVAKTPNLDKLASEGVMFTNVYSVSGVCAPSRSSLITGCYPTAIGTHNMRVAGTGSKPEGIIPHEPVLPPQVKTFTEHLRKDGYYCMNKGKRDYQFEAPRAAWDDLNGHWNKAPDDKPFFLYFNGFMVTHESSIWNNADHPELIDPDSVNIPPYYPDNGIIRKDIARMYSNIAEMDIMMGEYLDDLENKGLLDKSIVIFMSDNGGPLPRQKREVYDSGLKVPMIIRFPGKENAGTVVDDLISFVDLAPTMLSLAGVPIPESMHGQPFLGDQKATPRNYIYAARDRMDTEYDTRRAVRDKRYKYIRNYNPETGSYQPIQYRLNMDLMQELLRLKESGGLNEQQMSWFKNSKPEEELYDTWNDPHELFNLANDTNYRETLELLRQAHLDFKNNYPDLGFTPETELLNQWWPGLNQPVTPDPKFTFINDSTCTISCAVPGASISYQVVNPGEKLNDDWSEWKVFADNLLFKSDQNVFAVAHRIGYKESEIVGMGPSSVAFNKIKSYAEQDDASNLTLDELWTAGCENLVDSNLFIYKNFIEAENTLENTLEIQELVDKANNYSTILFYAKNNDASELNILLLIDLGILFRTDRLEWYKTAIANTEPEEIPTLTEFQQLIDNTITGKIPKEKAEVILYPNPCNDFIHLTANTPVFSIEIFDQLGKLIQLITTPDNLVIDVSDLKPGMYMYKIVLEHKTVIQYIVHL